MASDTSNKRQREQDQPLAAPVTGLAQAEDGDALLVLDDGTAVSVHSALLAIKSSTLRDTVDLAIEHSRGGSLQIPLPSTTAEEARALVVLLYSPRQESHMLGLPPADLQLLSSICHRFAFEGLLGLVDEALAKHSGGHCPEELHRAAAPVSFLTPGNVTQLYWGARSKGLTNFQEACASYIAAHAREVAEAAPADPLAPVLAQVAKGSRHRHEYDSRPGFRAGAREDGAARWSEHFGHSIVGAPAWGAPPGAQH